MCNKINSLQGQARSRCPLSFLLKRRSLMQTPPTVEANAAACGSNSHDVPLSRFLSLGQP
jgi:hypothetical protein